MPNKHQLTQREEKSATLKSADRNYISFIIVGIKQWNASTFFMRRRSEPFHEQYSSGYKLKTDFHCCVSFQQNSPLCKRRFNLAQSKQKPSIAYTNTLCRRLLCVTTSFSRLRLIGRRQRTFASFNSFSPRFPHTFPPTGNPLYPATSRRWSNPFLIRHA